MCVCVCVCVYAAGLCVLGFSHPHISSCTDPPVLNISESTVIVKEGDPLVLQCSFTKHTNDPNPFPTITWTDPSGRTLGGSQTTRGLTLTSNYTRSSASKGDRGVYTCSVNNCSAVGELSDAVTVTIYCEWSVCVCVRACMHAHVYIILCDSCIPCLGWILQLSITSIALQSSLPCQCI